MKTIKLAVLILLFPLSFFGQTLNGVWTGTISNDSTTIRKDQSFEMVLTQYKNKVYGYSRSDFIVNDTLFYIVKRVKGTIEGDVCEVMDDEIVAYNFRGRLNKGVKVITTFRLDHNDSAWKMSGDWKTNKTKKFYSISGKADLREEKDLSKSKIFPHLEELKLADEITFYKESKKAQEAVAVTKPPAKDNQTERLARETKPVAAPPKETKTDVIAATKQPEKKVSPTVTNAKNNEKTESFTQAKPESTAAIKPETDTKNNPLTIKEKPVTTVVTDNKKESIAIVQAKSGPAKENKQAVTTNNKKDVPAKEEKVVVEKQQPQKLEPVAASKPVDQKKDIVAETKITETKKQEPTQPVSMLKEADKPPIIKIAEAKPPVSGAAALVAERKVATRQIVTFRSDSLELALYDNGEVDGDTVSVLLNGEVILAKQGLKASAIKKTIHVSDDSLTMVLYAENLGKYPPNTGLLVVHDGDDTYQIRFSADLQQNAAVIFKRKKQ